MSTTSRGDSLATRVATECNTLRADIDAAFVSTTYAATTVFDLTSRNRFCNVAGNVTVDASNLTEGRSGAIKLILNGTHTVSFAAKFYSPVTIPAAAGTYVFAWFCSTGTEILTVLMRE